MPASQEQKVDFLLKKIGYSVSKTGIAEDESAISGSPTNTPKKPFEEGIPSPLIVPQSSLWADSGYIPTTPPGSDTAYVKVYSTTSALRMTRDTTVGTNTRSYIAYTTYNNTSSARLTNWIDTQFGSSYILKVFKDDPTVATNELPQVGANNQTDGWFFDYSSGVLNFNGLNLPSGINATNIYIVGYRYIGATGARPPAGIGTFEHLYVAGVSTFMGSIDANSNLDVAGISTFQGLIDANGLIEGIAGQNKIPSLYNAFSDLPNAGTYHGMFAHVHEHVKGYFAHGGGWYELVNKETDGRVGTGTESYNIGSLNVIGITTLGNIGISTGRITGPAITYIDPATVGDDTGTLVVKGNLQVEGTQTTVNSSTMTVTDKNIELAKGAANDAAADGGGITIDSGGGDKTWQWLDSTDSWTSSEHIRIPDDKVFGFASDTNTFISRPAADTIAFFHGGSEKVRIDSSGRLLVGTTTYSHSQDNLTVYDASNSIISIKSGGGGGANAYAQIAFKVGSEANSWIWKGGASQSATYGGAHAWNFSHNSNSPILFHTNNGSGLSEKLRITPDGKIGIGHHSGSQITHELTIRPENGGGISIKRPGDTASSPNVHLNITTTTSGSAFPSGEAYTVKYKTNNSDALFETYSSGGTGGNFSFRTGAGSGNQVERLRILANGNIGINSTAPVAKLDVNGNANISGRLTSHSARFEDDGTSDNPIVSVMADDHNPYGFQVGNSTYSTSPMRGHLLFVMNDGDVYHDFGSDTSAYTDVFFRLRNSSGTFKNCISFEKSDQSVELYAEGSKKLETNSSGINVTGITTTTQLEVGTLGQTLVGITTILDEDNMASNSATALVTQQSLVAYVGNSAPGGSALSVSADSGSNESINLNTEVLDIEGTANEIETATGTNKVVIGLPNDVSITNLTLGGTVSAGSSTGVNGYYLKTTGIGVTWAAFPSTRTGLTTSATAGQTTFNFSYNVGFLDVFLNGVKLPSSEFTASNGSTIILDDAAFANDTLEFVSFNTVPNSSAGAQNLTGLADVTITGTPVIGETLQHNGSQFVNDYTVTATTTSTSQTAILSLPVATYRSAEYTIQITEGTKYHVTKVLAIHNGTNVYFNEYGTLFTNSSLSTFALDVNSGNMRLLATPASTNSTVFKVKFTGIKV